MWLVETGKLIRRTDLAFYWQHVETASAMFASEGEKNEMFMLWEDTYSE